MSEASPFTEIRISADSHVSEPPDLWDRGLPAKYRARAPRFPNIKLGTFNHSRPGGWDPVERLKDMAADGISAEVLFPTIAKEIYYYVGQTGDIDLAQAWDQTYNDWMIEFCEEAPDRLWGQAHIGLWDIDYAVKELERARRAGLKAATTWIAPPDGIPWTGDHYERFWSACEDLQMPVTMHINVGFGVYAETTPQTRARGAVQAVARMAYVHKMVAMQCLAELTLSGAFERHPRLKLLLAEYDCGWIPFFLEDLDRKFGRGAGKDLGLTLLPSEYISRQVYATFMQDAVAGFLLQQWGADNFLYSNDYPHAGGIWPYTDDTVALTLSRLSPDTRRKVLGENVAKVFGLPMPEPMPRQRAPGYTDAIWSRPWLKKAGEFSFDKPKMGLAV